MHSFWVLLLVLAHPPSPWAYPSGTPTHPGDTQLPNLDLTTHNDYHNTSSRLRTEEATQSDIVLPDTRGYEDVVRKLPRTDDHASTEPSITPFAQTLEQDSYDGDFPEEAEKSDDTTTDGSWYLMNGETPPACKVCSCSNQYRSVNCEHRKLQKIPDGIPVNVTSLFLGNNPLVELPANAFISLVNLEILSLKKCALKSESINVNAFRGLNRLKQLFLTQNHLKNISAELFQDTSSLTRVYFSQNTLTVIPDLRYCTSLSKLGLDNNQFKQANFPIGYRNLTQLSTIVLSNNPLTSFSSSDVENLLDCNIRSVTLSRCLLSGVDAGVFSNFTRLQSLSISYNEKLTMKSLQNIISALSQSRQLTFLDLSGSVHEPLPSDLFQGYSKVPLGTLKMTHMKNVDVIENGTFYSIQHMQFLDISASGLQVIQNGAFNKKSNLTRLDASSNVLEVIPNDLPFDLQILDLSNNNAITQINPSQFAGLHSMKNLSLKNCGISIISESALDDMTNLESLDLSHNLISGIGKYYINLINLKVLSLKANNLRQLTEPNAFLENQKLEILDVSDNLCWKIIPDIFSPLTSLKTLDLSGNSLSSVIGHSDQCLFTSLQNLQVLIIERSGLTSNNLQKSVFADLTSLLTLRLGSNAINDLPEDVFTQNNNLQFLNFSHNMISVIHESFIKGLPYNISLDITHNSFSCWCDLIWFRNWMGQFKNATHINITVHLLGNDTYTCDYPTTMIGKKVWDFHPSDIHQKCFPLPWKYIVIGTGAGAAGMIVALVGLAYKYRWPMKLQWYRTTKSCRRNKPKRRGYTQIYGNDRGSQYNAFISYGPSDADMDWVEHILVPKLDKDIQGEYQLYFEARDAMPNESTIGQIADAIYHSDKLLLVISSEYLGNSRRQYEMQLVLSSLEESGKNMDNILLLVLDPKASVKVPKVLHPLTSTHRELDWPHDDVAGQEVFWNQLKSRLGEVSCQNSQ